MPITRADLKISRNYWNRIALRKHKFITSVTTGAVLTGASLTVGAVTSLDEAKLLGLGIAFISGIVSCNALTVPESAKKRLARLMVENKARKELDFAR